MKDIRIAAVIFNSAVGQVQHNLERMLPWIKKAKKEGADLICFPELNVTGYSTKPEIKGCAESIPGPISERLVQMAQENQIVILAGMAEKDEKGRIFASHLVVTPQNISGIYRKIHIAPPERHIFLPAIQSRCSRLMGLSWVFNFAMTPISPNFPPAWRLMVPISFSCPMPHPGEPLRKNWPHGCAT